MRNLPAIIVILSCFSFTTTLPAQQKAEKKDTSEVKGKNSKPTKGEVELTEDHNGSANRPGQLGRDPRNPYGDRNQLMSRQPDTARAEGKDKIATLEEEIESGERAIAIRETRLAESKERLEAQKKKGELSKEDAERKEMTMKRVEDRLTEMKFRIAEKKKLLEKEKANKLKEEMSGKPEDTNPNSADDTDG